MTLDRRCFVCDQTIPSPRPAGTIHLEKITFCAKDGTIRIFPVWLCSDGCYSKLPRTILRQTEEKP